jgi:hypothetical protein
LQQQRHQFCVTGNDRVFVNSTCHIQLPLVVYHVQIIDSFEHGSKHKLG